MMKKMGSLALGLAVLVTLTACGNSEKDYKAAIDEGNDAIISKDYDKAVSSFEKALTHKKSDEVAQDSIEQVKSYQEATKLEENAELKKAKEATQEVIDTTDGSAILVERGHALLDKITVLEENEVKYQNLYDQAKKEYDAEEYDAAGGTIQILLSKELEHKLYTPLKDKATKLKNQIIEAQKKVAQAKKEQATAQASTKYAKERNSKVFAQEFLNGTGKNIDQATDEEIAAWIAQQAEADAKPVPSNPSKTEADKKLEVQQAVVKITGYSDASNDYYITVLNDDLYQVEIRNSQSDADISNMVGMFQYKPSTNELTKMDPVTGEYSPFVAQ